MLFASTRHKVAAAALMHAAAVCDYFTFRQHVVCLESACSLGVQLAGMSAVSCGISQTCRLKILLRNASQLQVADVAIACCLSGLAVEGSDHM